MKNFLKMLVATILVGGASQASAFGTSCVKDWFEYYQMSHNRPQISRFATVSAFASINSRLGST